MIPSLVFGQFYHEPVAPSLQGGALLQALLAEYKTTTVLGDSEVKDVLMADIYYDASAQEVRCIYTEHARPLSPNSDDPNQEVFDNGQASGINVEHIYPRNKGAKIGIAESDMHHLAPAKVNVNGDRNNLPFGEIVDSQTDRWYYLSMERTSPPSAEIDLWSEWTNVAFEPRESVKGDVARAMMYFYTMYRDFADGEDDMFFAIQQETLCDWHYRDPVDSAEWHRTWRIAQYQEGKPNPYVLDCSVAARTYCGDTSSECIQTVDTDDLSRESFTVGHAYPNPTSYGEVTVPFSISRSSVVGLVIYDLLGRQYAHHPIEYGAGNHAITVALPHAGQWIVEIVVEDHESVQCTRQIISQLR